MNVRSAILFPCLAFLLLAGCKSASLPAPVTPKVLAEHRALLDTQREQMAMVPPPSKNRYMAVHSFDNWENPYITVQPDMLTLHVLLADANPSPVGAGGMFRPVGARREAISIRMDKLAEAMTSVPQNSWPYGRVIAIEEAHKTPAAMEPTIRRNMETAIGTLSDLGIMVYDLNEGSLR